MKICSNNSLKNKIVLLMTLLFAISAIGAKDNSNVNAEASTAATTEQAGGESQLAPLTSTDQAADAEKVLLADAGDATTGDVAACFIFIEAVVATAGSAAAINTVAMKLAIAAEALGAKATATMGALIASAKLTRAEEALARVLLKMAMDKAKSSATDALVQAAWKNILAIAQQIYTSCKSIAYTFVSTGSAIISAVTQPVACGTSSNHANWVECQRSCGVSVPASQQLTMWGIPASCSEKIKTGLRNRFVNSYARFCLTKHCSGGPTSSSRTTQFSQCTLVGGSSMLPAPISEMGKWCKRYDLAVKF